MISEQTIQLYPQNTESDTVAPLIVNNEHKFNLKRYIGNMTDLKCRKIALGLGMSLYLILLVSYLIVYFTYIKPTSNECDDIKSCCQTEINPFIRNNLTLPNSTQQNCLDNMDWCYVDGYNGLTEPKAKMCQQPDFANAVFSGLSSLILLPLLFLGSCFVYCKNNYFR